MKKICQPLTFLLISLPIMAFALPDWVTSLIDARVSVQTPVALSEIDMVKILTAQGASKEQTDKLAGSRIFTSKDAAGTYMVMCFPEGELGPDISSTNNRTSFYDGMIDKMIKNDQGLLLERTPFTVGGAEGVDFKYRGIHKLTKKMVVKSDRVILLDKVCYTLTLIPADIHDSTGVTGKQERARFYNSMIIKPSASPGK